jgi:HSP20 family protein
MYEKDKRSFFERLTGTINVEEEAEKETEEEFPTSLPILSTKQTDAPKPLEEEQHDLFDEDTEEVDNDTLETLSEDEEVGELAVDVYEDGEDIYIQAMVAGVDPDDIDVSITRDMVTLKGKRVNPTKIADENYYHKELYWGGFSRKILLPEEVDPENSEAVEKHGLLILKLPKLNKKRTQKLEVRSID